MSLENSLSTYLQNQIEEGWKENIFSYWVWLLLQEPFNL